MRRIRLAAFILTCALPALSLASDHSADYQVGIFSSTAQLSDGTFAQASGGTARAYQAQHNVHYVRTMTGLYAIQAPVAMAASMIDAMVLGPLAPVIHKEWFMDQLHEGDKILFRVRCNKHNDCEFYLPNPDTNGDKIKEVRTLGWYRPDNAQTNTQMLCGKGKLAPEVEAQICSAGVALTLTQKPVPQTLTQQPIAAKPCKGQDGVAEPCALTPNQGYRN
jgi:hypothetical protein